MTNTNRASLLLLAVAGSALTGCTHSADTGAVADQVRKQALALVEDYNTGDAAAAAAMDAPDYVGIFHGTPNVNGPAADLAGMKAQMAQGKVQWQIGEGKVTVAKAGDLALFEAPYTFTVAIPNAPVTRERGSWIAIFKRQDDGSMKLWRSIGSDLPKAAQ